MKTILLHVLKGEVIDTQTEIDEKGRKTTVSIQVVNTEDDHYHSTDSGIQVHLKVF